MIVEFKIQGLGVRVEGRFDLPARPIMGDHFAAEDVVNYIHLRDMSRDAVETIEGIIRSKKTFFVAGAPRWVRHDGEAQFIMRIVLAAQKDK